KADNVLVGKDGRVRVSDFGLAGLTAAPGPLDAEKFGTAETVQFSRTLRGTPAYMAPEQHLNERVDARSDQFSFGVALYEALFGSRPFRGDSLAELRIAVLESALPARPRDRQVPAWVRAILVRRLERRPEDRFPSMAAVVAALENDPARRRRRAALVAGLAALAGLAAVGFLRRPAAVACDGNRDRISAVWNDGRRLAMAGAFAASRRPYALDAEARAVRAIDGYADALSAMHRETCE